MTGSLRGMADAPTPNRRPRWYQDLRWILAGLVLVVASTTLYGLFGPDTPIVVSPATTVITEPLAADGLPDYAAHVLARAGRGTPPDDNAAVPLLMALWPLKFDEADLPAVCKELGIELPSPPPVAFQGDDFSRDAGIRAAMVNRLSDPNTEADTRFNPVIERIDAALEAATRYPWRAADLPALDAWVVRHGERFDRVVEASQRPRLYLPNPTLLRGSRGAVLDSNWVLLNPLRQALRGVHLRAMWHLGSGRPDNSWRDILAMHRFARLVGSGNDGSFLDQLVAVALSATACDATLLLLDTPGVSAELLATIRHDLERLPPLPPRERLDNLEQIGVADGIVHMTTMPRSARRAWIEMTSEAASDPLNATSIDGNVILEQVHAAHAASDQVLRLDSWADRERAFSALEDAESAGARTTSRFDVLRRLLNRGARSEHIGRNLVATRLPHLRMLDAAVTRNEAICGLTCVAAALAACRAADNAGAYPARLEDLAPRFLDRIPTDPFTGGPFVYERRGAGYLLYSFGPNGRDDGGTDLLTPIVTGEWVEESPHLGDVKTTDVVVRLPLPGSPILERLRARP